MHNIFKHTALIAFLFFRKICRYVIAYMNFWYLYFTVKNRVSPSSEIPNGRLLIVVPHADDELIACHSLINNHGNVKLFFCSYTGTNSSIINKVRRESEFIQYCLSRNIEYVISSPNVYSSLVSEIHSYQPTCIAIPSIIDWHREHRIVSDMLYEYLNSDNRTSIKEVIIYSISFPMHYSFVNCTVGMSRLEQNVKWTTFKKIYLSQNSLPIYRFKLWERLYSRCFDVKYGVEYFHVFVNDDWTSWYIKKRNHTVPQNIIYNMINSLQLSFQIYMGDE